MKYEHKFTGEIDQSTVTIGSLKSWDAIDYRLRDLEIIDNTKTNDMNKERKPKFELFKSEKDEQWYFNLIAPNGEIIASSEGYRQKEGALNGIESIKLNAPIAKLMVEMERY